MLTRIVILFCVSLERFFYLKEPLPQRRNSHGKESKVFSLASPGESTTRINQYKWRTTSDEKLCFGNKIFMMKKCFRFLKKRLLL